MSSPEKHDQAGGMPASISPLIKEAQKDRRSSKLECSITHPDGTVVEVKYSRGLSVRLKELFRMVVVLAPFLISSC